MKILLFGASGQLGRQLQRDLCAAGQLVAYSRSNSQNRADFLQPESLPSIVQHEQPEIIVNASAWTAVDAAEDHRHEAHLVNALAPAMLAEAARQQESLLIHFSTDYVFNGTGGKPWAETDQPAPLNIYGATKLAGEQAIAASDCHHLIFRTSWVFSAEGSNFLKTMVKLAETKESLTIVGDQWGAPTSASFLSDVTQRAIALMAQGKPAPSGLYHASLAGETNWYDYAEFIFAELRAQGKNLTVTEVKPTLTKDYPTKARRPLNSRLNTGKLQQAFALTPPDWQGEVASVLQQLMTSEGAA